MHCSGRHRFGASRALLCLAALIATAARASAAGADLSGTDPLGRWVAAMPASCAFHKPTLNYWVGSPITHDDDQLPVNHAHEWLTHKGENPGTQEIAAYYDPAHKLALYSEFGNEISNKALVSGAPPPPPDSYTMRLDLSAVHFAQNVHLGDTVTQVAGELGMKAPLKPQPGTGACADFKTVGVCSWNAPDCKCPPTARIARSGSIIFRKGRVVALFWNDIPCLR